VEYEIRDRDAYASVLSFNLTTGSSIPDEVSSVSTSIVSQGSTVFRGPIATIVPYILTPSIFENQISGEEETGYHVNLESRIIAGSTQLNNQIYSTSGLRVTLNLQVSDAALLTRRIPKMLLITLVSTLLGSVFAIMGAFGAMMAFIERKLRNREAKRLAQKETRNQMESMAALRTSLETVPGRNKRPPIAQHGTQDSMSHDESAQLLPMQESRSSEDFPEQSSDLYDNYDLSGEP
jgi:hypothetical protein